MTNEEHIEQLKKLRSFHNGSYGRSINKAIEALEQEPCKVSEYDKDHIWYKGHQYISLRRFLEVKAEAEQEPYDDTISRKSVLDFIKEWSLGGWVEVPEEEWNKFVLSLPLAKQEPKWIPVSERLPEDGQEILFSTKTGRVHCGRYHDDNSANKWYSYRDKCRAWNNVVDAWMPLPTPYQQEVEE